jgi:outer membrane receptor protein involved in Fe transport
VFETLDLSAMITNLLDIQYVDPSPFATLPGDYPRPGRSVLAKVSYKF